MGIITVGKRVTVQLSNEWRHLAHLRHCNWYTFTVLSCVFELDNMAREYALQLSIMGFGLYLRYDHDYEHSRLKQMAEDAWKEITEENWTEIEEHGS